MFRRRFMARRQVGLMFTDQSSSTLIAQQAGIKYEKTVTGVFDDAIEWDKTASNVYLCTSDFSAINTVSSGTAYYLVAFFNGKKYALGAYEQNLTVIEATNGNSFDNHFKWYISSFSKGYRIYNAFDNNTYANVDQNGNLSLGEADASGYFTQSSGLLSYAYIEGSAFRPYRYSSSQLVLSSNTKYTSFICELSSVEEVGSLLGDYKYIFTKTKSTSNSIVGNNRWLVLRTQNSLTTNYYLVGHNGTKFSIYSIGFNYGSDDNSFTFYLEDDSSSFSAYRLVVSQIGTKYTIRFQDNQTLFIKPPVNVSNNQVFSVSTDTTGVSYNDNTGVYVTSLTVGPFGISAISSGYTTVPVNGNLTVGGTTIVFRKEGSTWSPYYGSLNTGDTYAIAVRKMPTDENHPGNNTASYYLVGYNGTNLVAHEFATLEDIVITSDCEFTATSGTNGCGLVIGNKGLNVNNNNLAMLDVSADWLYIGDASVPDNSRLWTVTTQTTDYYTEYANSDLEANTQATDTTCDIFLVQNGKVQIQADEFVDGETYVLVFVDNGNHYAACVNGTDIVPVLYANSLPKNLPSDYHFVAEASGQGFILKHNNQAMGVAVNTKLTLGYSAVWTYTGGTNE